MANVQLFRIDLADVGPNELEARMREYVQNGDEQGYKLQSTFTYQTQLVMVFVRYP